MVRRYALCAFRVFVCKIYALRKVPGSVGRKVFCVVDTDLFSFYFFLELHWGEAVLSFEDMIKMAEVLETGVITDVGDSLFGRDYLFGGVIYAQFVYEFGRGLIQILFAGSGHVLVAFI